MAFQRENILPLFLVIALVCFIPMCIFFTLNITSSMQRYSKQEDTPTILTLSFFVFS
jgi:hypothetical protein